MLPYTMGVLKSADIVLFVVDIRRGISPEDRHFALYVVRCWLATAEANTHLCLLLCPCFPLATCASDSLCTRVTSESCSTWAFMAACRSCGVFNPLACRVLLSWVKKHRKGALHVVANKSDGLLSREDAQEVWDGMLGDLYSLGMGEATAVSAEHGDGLADLFLVLEPFSRPAEAPGVLGPSEAAASAGVQAGTQLAAPAASTTPVLPSEDAGKAPRFLRCQIVCPVAVSMSAPNVCCWPLGTAHGCFWCVGLPSDSSEEPDLFGDRGAAQCRQVHACKCLGR